MNHPKKKRVSAQTSHPRPRQSTTLLQAQLRATLYSIGDAVIVTDAKGRVTMMNPIAEGLTGWRENEALGKPLAQVFRIINEETRAEVENPVARVLRQGIVLGLANHTVLIARDGREIPIADSGAPVRNQRGKIAGVVLVFRDQTKERQIQNIIREARDFAESIVATVREPLVVLDANLRVIAANQSFYRTFRVSPAETDGRPIYELGNRQWDIPQLRTLLEKILPQNTHLDDFVVEHQFEHIGQRTMLLNARRLRHVNVQAPMILLAIEDITERQRAEIELQKSEERYRHISEMISDYVYAFRVDADGTMRGEWITDSFLHVFGYTLPEVDARGGWQTMVHPDDLPIALQHAQRVLSGKLDVCEMRFVTRAGEARWLRDYAIPVWDPQQNRVIRIYGAAQDITERKRAESALQESEERFRMLTESSLTGIYLIQEGRFRYVNPALAQIFGYQVEELIDIRSPLDLTHPDDRPRVTELIRQRIRGQVKSVRYEFRGLRKDGSHCFIEAHGLRADYQGQPAIIGTLIDITERKRHERELEAQALIAQALSETIELPALLERLIAAAMHAIPAAEKGSLALLTDAEHLQVRALNGYHDSSVLGFTYPITWGYAGRAAREQSPLLIADIQADAILQADAARVASAEVQALRSALAAPLLSGGTVIGVLSLESTQPNAFTEHDLHILTTVSATATLIIERHRLFEQAQRRAERIAAVNALGRALAATLDLPTIYRTAYQHIRTLVPCDNLAITLYDDTTHTLRAAFILSDEQELDVNLLPPLTLDPNTVREGRAKAVLDAQTVIVNDLAVKTQQGSGIIIGNHRTPQSAVYTPMLVESRIIGLLELQSYRNQAYQADDLDLLHMLANQIGLAIQNARLFDDLRIHLTELETLHTIASICIQAKDENRLIEQITHVVGNNLYPDNFGFLLMNAEGTYLLPHPAYRGVTLKNIPAQIPLNAGITGRVAASGKPYRTGNVRMEDAYIEINPATRSELCVPLIVGGRVLGVINAESHKLNAFSETDEHLLATAASQVATALERLRLLNETQRRLHELEVLQQVSSALRVAHTAQEMIPIFIAHAARAVAARAGSIYLLEEASGDWVSQGWLNESGEWIAMPGAALRHHAGEGVTGRVGATGEIYVTADWRTDPVNVIQPGEQTLLNELCGGISLPLRAEQRIIGVMHVWFAQTPSLTEQTQRLLTAIADIAGNALQRARLFEETQRRLDELNTLHQASQTLLLNELDPEATYVAIHQAIERTMPCEALSIVLEDEALGDYHGVYLYDKDGRTPSQRIPRGAGLSGLVIPSGKTLLIDDYLAQDEIQAVHFGNPEHVRSILAVPLRRGEQTIGMVATQSYQPHAFTQEHRVLLETLAAQFATSIENAHLYQQTRLRLRELEIVSAVSAALRTAPSHKEMFSIVLDQLLTLFEVDGAAIQILNPANGELQVTAARGVWASLVGLKIPRGAGVSAQILATGTPYLNNDVRNDPNVFYPYAFEECRAAAGVLVAVQQQIIGLLWIASKRLLSEHDLRLLGAVADIAGNAIHRATLNEQTERHLSQLATLHAIDRAISSSFDLRLTLNLLLEHVTTQLHVDAASVLLLNPQTHVLEYAASRGFRTRAVEQTRIRLGENFAGRVALERQSIHLRDLPAHAKEFVVTELVAEGFAEYYGAPLIAKGNVVGVMQIFHHAPLPTNPEWRDFCETLAGQAAIAIDNARLFEGLQQANLELGQAYEATIEGWSRALDLRDKETEGHTQRVTEMTLELARALGIGEDEIVHLRRGALLHDIGKMGVPDNILLKPDKLTEAEMAIMRQHPQRAYELLLPIEYLRPALDIPYCHHEKWDGTGYPRGLKGEEIPLVARLFAVVDVYDALTSDRPYRKAWSREDALAYIRQQAGQHFDPHVVEIFLKLFGK